jgi:two-component system chemotaxis response regulator CheB
MQPSPIVVAGASLGGVDAFQRLVAELPSDFEAPLLLVLHIGNYRSVLPRLLEAKGGRPAMHPADGDVIRPRHIYVAPPDRHMLVDGPVVRLSKGPKEHHSRPAIDPLFRSAALTRGEDVIGLVMTGALNDGSAGLQAIKATGGRAVVQDPDDAFEPSMPASALAWVDVDAIAPLHELPAVLDRLATQSQPRSKTVAKEHLLIEQQWFLGMGNVMEHMERTASPSTYVCPDCKGSLWEITDSRPVRYRCHTGHAYTLRTLYETQFAQTDEALWNAVRALQEQELLLDRLIAESTATGDTTSGEAQRSMREQVRERAEALRRLATSQ